MFSLLEADVAEETGSIRLFPEVPQTLQALRAHGVKIGVVSNLAQPYGLPLLDLLPFAPDVRAFSYEVGARKPEAPIYRYAWEEHGCAPEELLMVGDSLQNSVELAAKPRPAKGRERRLEEGEEERLLAAASPRFRPVILFALETAMRREEIASLFWRNVNIRGRYVLLPETKNCEVRTVSLAEGALAVLRELPRSLDQGPVFGLSADQITASMKYACKKAKLENRRVHDLRHEATSRLFELTDLDVMEIKAITGHKMLPMRARYTHLRTARLADRSVGVKRG